KRPGHGRVRGHQQTIPGEGVGAGQREGATPGGGRVEAEGVHREAGRRRRGEGRHVHVVAARRVVVGGVPAGSADDEGRGPGRGGPIGPVEGRVPAEDAAGVAGGGGDDGG